MSAFILRQNYKNNIVPLPREKMIEQDAQV